MFAKFSPECSARPTCALTTSTPKPWPPAPSARLTHDASRTIVNGSSDWVYEEEFGLRDAFRWSPDGRRIAYLQFDKPGVRDTC